MLTETQQRQQDGADKLMIELKDGVLKDTQDRTGYIAANHQFQFDGPPQTGAIYTAGWSACQNGSLALGGSTVFHQCLSGDFYNLYDDTQGKQCNEVTINIVGGGSSGAQASVTQVGDGQPQAATSAAPVSQISDGQPQAATSASAAPVSQISDGQVQASTAAGAVSQISDGQVQAPTSAPAAPVSQISDGQVQAATSTAAAVSQIPDGQVQAPYPANNATAAAPSGTGSAQSPAPFEGAAAQTQLTFGAGLLAIFGLVAAL